MSLNPATYNTTVYQGATFLRTFTASAGIDFGDYETIRMSIRKKPSDVTPIWSSETDGNEDHFSWTDEAITVDIPPETTEDWEFNTAGFDIELEKSDGTVDKLIRGTITLVKEYTKE